MDERIATGSADLVDLGPAVAAAGEVRAAAGISHLGLELVGMRAPTGGGVHQTVEYGSVADWYGATLSSAGIRIHSTG